MVGLTYPHGHAQQRGRYHNRRLLAQESSMHADEARPTRATTLPLSLMVATIVTKRRLSSTCRYHEHHEFFIIVPHTELSIGMIEGT